MMRQLLLRMPCLPALSVGALLVLQGCNTMGGQPEMVDARIAPDALRPGDEALITVQLKDKNRVVSGIEGVVQEDQRITFDLNDQGEQSDVKAGDGVWSFGVKVPFQAPEGQFLLELTAYREDGNPVSIRQKDGGVAALQQTVPLVINATAAGAPAVEAAPAEAAPSEEAPAEEAPPAEEPETDPQAGESPSEAGDNAEDSAGSEAPTTGNEPERNPKSLGGNGDGDEAEEEEPKETRKERRERERREKEEAEAAVEEAQPVEEAAPAGGGAATTE